MENTQRLSITITGEEALDDLKKFFPNDWGIHVQSGKDDIKSMMRLYNLPPVQAVEKACRMSGGFKNPTIVTAALFIMLKQERISNDVKRMYDESQQITSQSFALESSENFNTKESGELRQYYTAKQNELQSRIDQLIDEFPVVQPIVVRPGQF